MWQNFGQIVTDYALELLLALLLAMLALASRYLKAKFNQWQQMITEKLDLDGETKVEELGSLIIARVFTFAEKAVLEAEGAGARALREIINTEGASETQINASKEALKEIGNKAVYEVLTALQPAGVEILEQTVGDATAFVSGAIEASLELLKKKYPKTPYIQASSFVAGESMPTEVQHTVEELANPPLPEPSTEEAAATSEPEPEPEESTETLE